MAGTHGYNTKLAGASSGTIGSITSITLPSRTVAAIKVTDLDATNKWETYIPGMRDAGELSLELNFDGSASGNSDALNTALTAAVQVWTITFPDGSTFAASGFITSLGGGSANNDDKITETVTLKFTAAPTFTDVAPA